MKLTLHYDFGDYEVENVEEELAFLICNKLNIDDDFMVEKLITYLDYILGLDDLVDYFEDDLYMELEDRAYNKHLENVIEHERYKQQVMSDYNKSKGVW